MEMTTLKLLLKENTEFEFFENAIRIKTLPEWAVSGESNLSYVTLIRLVECCREYHSDKDMTFLPEHIDVTCRAIDSEFYLPVASGDIIDISYFVTEVGEHSYELLFVIKSPISNQKHAVIKQRLVFIDRKKYKKITVPSQIREQMICLLAQSSQEKLTKLRSF